jgi:hypothetical protein
MRWSERNSKVLNWGVGTVIYTAFVHRFGVIPFDGSEVPVMSKSEGFAILGASERSELAPVV